MSSPPPPPPGPSGHGQPPRQTGLVVGLACAGAFGYWVVNLFVGLIAITFESRVAVGVGAAALALGALGGGVLLVLRRKPWALGLGLGLMIGWALASIVTAGFCTGINPELYA
ncbi:hypothetical protein [Nonomuraea roseoviolacea]|uniref:DUF4190 domain-containing protein n=1 Tax=Nonomuraea roseoviolacea subsp. carminata TaxID=160689 RepID=A0ABT1K266_9ACTN|nr:hypothetical protein [Nonomuraea roseoviolacea]MCP2347104.1 hypothetical protein [Nonomuraea roseoviolacea subsp. carminata]